MRDISVSKLGSNGLATFALADIALVSGLSLIVAKVTKKVLSKTFSTSLFSYYGLDLKNIPFTGISDKSIDVIRTILSSSLKNIETSIQDNTSKKALPTERLSSLSLEDIVYDPKNSQIFIKVKIYPIQGDSTSVLFPLDA